MRYPYALTCSLFVLTAVIGASVAQADLLVIGPLDVPVLSIPGDEDGGEVAQAAAVEVEQFDPGMGILKEIRFDLQVDFAGTVGYENKGALTSFVTTTVTWGFSLLDPLDPNSGELLHVDAERVFVNLAEGFDGNIDFGGFSGRTYGPAQGAVGSGIDSRTLDDPNQALFKAFVGTGSVSLDAAADYSLEASGLPPVEVMKLAEDMQVTGGSLTVTYDYIVPEPAALALALAVATLVRRR